MMNDHPKFSYKPLLPEKLSDTEPLASPASPIIVGGYDEGWQQQIYIPPAPPSQKKLVAYWQFWVMLAAIGLAIIISAGNYATSLSFSNATPTVNAAITFEVNPPTLAVTSPLPEPTVSQPPITSTATPEITSTPNPSATVQPGTNTPSNTATPLVTASVAPLSTGTPNITFTNSAIIPGTALPVSTATALSVATVIVPIPVDKPASPVAATTAVNLAPAQPLKTIAPQPVPTALPAPPATLPRPTTVVVNVPPPTVAPKLSPQQLSARGQLTYQAAGCNVKGNISLTTGEKIYHVPGQQFYDETIISPEFGERWFCTEGDAVNNGWRKSKK